MKRWWLTIIGGVVGTAVLAGATVFAWRWLLHRQVSFRLAEESLAQLPEITARQAGARAELEKRAQDVQRIHSFLITKDQIGIVVGEIESAARSAGVEMTVPAVEEKEQVDENGQPVMPPSPLFEVRLKIVATGRPDRLLSFLHAAEHIQRLVYLESFRFDGSPETARNQAVALRRGEVAEGDRPALLTADVIVAVERQAQGGSP